MNKTRAPLLFSRIECPVALDAFEGFDALVNRGKRQKPWVVPCVLCPYGGVSGAANSYEPVTSENNFLPCPLQFMEELFGIVGGSEVSSVNLHNILYSEKKGAFGTLSNLQTRLIFISLPTSNSLYGVEPLIILSNVFEVEHYCSLSPFLCEALDCYLPMLFVSTLNDRLSGYIMLSKGPHISIEAPSLVPRILRIPEREFAEWPDAVRTMSIKIAEELFLAMYNPFIPASMVRQSVNEQFSSYRLGLAQHYANSIDEGITMFWSAWEEDDRFRSQIIDRFHEEGLESTLDTSRFSRVASMTDATDLRLELPMLVVSPSTAEEVSKIVRLANEMQFALIPRGGGSGMTGGAVPARKRTVVMSLTKMTTIGPIDTEQKTMTVQAGVITSRAIDAAKEKGLFFSVDPASKMASSIGGNIAENAGGPVCFEYGTTIDNLLSFKMVTPTGEIIVVSRKDHPGHKIMPEDEAIFEVRDISDGLRSVIRLKGTELRKEGLGKDVTNKALNGLPGVQKEGTDGIILEATFMLHDIPDHFKVVVIEFFGRSMENSMLVIKDIVSLRDTIRENGDLVKITALEEFGMKYVQVIGYQKKSKIHEGDPISVLILQLESDDMDALEDAVRSITYNCALYDSVATFVAKDETEAELFWEDRHKFSAIAKRTSGFKINEDIVIPVEAIPTYAAFLEALNVEYMARAYRWALKKASNLHPALDEDPLVMEELSYVMRVINKEIPFEELSEQELELHAIYGLGTLAKNHPTVAKELLGIEKRMQEARITVASHMHAGDGNWHVNIPVNSNDPMMLRNAEIVAGKVMAKAQELGGEVTGEHGVGITKISFLSDEKMAAFKEYKELVDPRNIMNPAKLTQRQLPVMPFTFSFNHLIEDIRQSGLQDKERLISLLANVQVCTRCGKCKFHCVMYFPEQNMRYQPRNKNMVLGALIEAIYYTQVHTGKADMILLSELNQMVEHCTGCGKCESVCPLKIASAEVALDLRGYLETEGATGHRLKAKALKFVEKAPERRLPLMGKMASFGQGMQNKILHVVPQGLRKQFYNPLFSGFGPKPHYRNMYEVLHLDRGSYFVPEGKVRGTVLYFVGCGGGIFFREVGIAGLALLLNAGYGVVLPKRPQCCGYPLLAAGDQEGFATNQDRNIVLLRELAESVAALGAPITEVLTACGSCLDGMERHFIGHVLKHNGNDAVRLDDLGNFLFPLIKGSLPGYTKSDHIIFQSPCHAQIPHEKASVSGQKYAKKIADTLGATVKLSPGCCGESGLGAMSSPAIYNIIRDKKSLQLEQDIEAMGEKSKVLVSCPSCKMGLSRIFMNKGEKREVAHLTEFFAEDIFGKNWLQRCTKALAHAQVRDGVRKIDMTTLRQ